MYQSPAERRSALKKLQNILERMEKTVTKLETVSSSTQKSSEKEVCGTCKYWIAQEHRCPYEEDSGFHYDDHICRIDQWSPVEDETPGTDEPTLALLRVEEERDEYRNNFHYVSQGYLTLKEEFRKFLKGNEWLATLDPATRSGSNERRRCFGCGNFEEEGHREDCEIQYLLDKCKDED